LSCDEVGTDTWKTLTGIEALSPDDTKTIKVDL